MTRTICGYTGKSLSEALIFASTNPQYDYRLFIELQVQDMKIPSSNLVRTCCVQKLFLTFRTIFVQKMFSPCSAKRRASDKDLPVYCIPTNRMGNIIVQNLFAPKTYLLRNARKISVYFCFLEPNLWLD